MIGIAPMCLITFAYNTHPEYRLILVANRDEFFPRPTKAAEYWDDEPTILAGRDLQMGGTWLGVNKTGHFTAITNYRDGRNPDKDKLSRGLLTREYLSSDESANEFIQRLQPQADHYGGFNLLCMDSEEMHYLSNKGASHIKLQAGIYAVSNAFMDTPWPKTTAAKQALINVVEKQQLDVESLSRILHNPEQAADELLPDTGISQLWEKSLSSSFIKLEDYGTRCTTVVKQRYDGSVEFYEISFYQNGSHDSRCYTFQTNA